MHEIRTSTQPKLTSSLSLEAAAEVNVALAVTLLFFLMMEAPPPTVDKAEILALLFPECGLFLPLMAGGLASTTDLAERAICYYFSAFSADSMPNLLRRCQIAKPK